MDWIKFVTETIDLRKYREIKKHQIIINNLLNDPDYYLDVSECDKKDTFGHIVYFLEYKHKSIDNFGINLIIDENLELVDAYLFEIK